MNKQSFLEGDKFEDYSTSDLIEIVDNGLLFERARAVFFLAKRCKHQEEIIPKVIENIFDSKNKNAKLFGTMTVSFLGIGGLFEANTLKTKKIIDDFIKTLSKYEHENLIDFLKQFNDIEIQDR